MILMMVGDKSGSEIRVESLRMRQLCIVMWQMPLEKHMFRKLRETNWEALSETKIPGIPIISRNMV
jgi:hypothetical protein